MQGQAQDKRVWPRLDPAEEFLRIGASATEFPGDREQARAQFRRHKAIHLRNLLSPEFLTLVLQLCATGSFIGGEHPDGPEVEAPQRVNRVLDAALQRTTILRWMEEVTGVERLCTFGGRLTQTRAGTGKHRAWHDDLMESSRRRLALVLNLSPERFAGGEFQLRQREGEPVFEHGYDTVNEAILFLVDPELIHRVRPVTAGGPRRIFAGWALA